MTELLLSSPDIAALCADTDPTSVAIATREAWHEFKRGGWRFVVLLARADKLKVWQGSGQPNFVTWCAQILGIENDDMARRYLRVGKFVLRRPEREQERWFAVPVSNAIEVLPVVDKDPAEALFLCETLPQHRIRPMLRMRRPAEEHHDTSPRRTVSFNVSANVAADMERALNLVRVHLGVGGSKYPSDDEVLMAVAQTVRQAPELQVPEHYREDVEAGVARCAMCKGWSKLERHHCVPRSQGGHDGPLVWLCHDDHTRITNRVDGVGWRELAAILGYEETADGWTKKGDTGGAPEGAAVNGADAH